MVLTGISSRWHGSDKNEIKDSIMQFKYSTDVGIIQVPDWYTTQVQGISQNKTVYIKVLTKQVINRYGVQSKDQVICKINEK